MQSQMDLFDIDLLMGSRSGDVSASFSRGAALRLGKVGARGSCGRGDAGHVCGRVGKTRSRGIPTNSAIDSTWSPRRLE